MERPEQDADRRERDIAENGIIHIRIPLNSPSSSSLFWFCCSFAARKGLEHLEAKNLQNEKQERRLQRREKQLLDREEEVEG